jgi:anion transporter
MRKKSSRVSCWMLALLSGISAVTLLWPTPAGLTPAGQRVMAIAILAVGLWSTEVVPMAITGMAVVVMLVLLGAVDTYQMALYGFSQPVAYFLIGVLTLGLAVSKSGLADRMARFFLRRCRGQRRALYTQLLLAFPVLTLVLPSATTRTGILIHVYAQALELSGVRPDSHLSRAIMMALNSINRLASTVLLTGGITPVVSASLIGQVSWSRWFILMSVPYGVLLLVGAILIYRLYRRGFQGEPLTIPDLNAAPLSPAERRTIVIALGASLLWLTDAWHHWHPALPALLAWIALLVPQMGIMSWREFEHEIGWSNFFVLATSLSLANALIQSGAGAWLATRLLQQVPILQRHPLLVVLGLLVASTPIRLLIPNITGFLAITIPLAMSIGAASGLNPIVCGLLVMIAGDAVLYYPAQSASSLVVYERGFLSAEEIFRFGIVMTVVAYLIVFAIALPYWGAVGEPLRFLQGH